MFTKHFSVYDSAYEIMPPEGISICFVDTEMKADTLLSYLNKDI